MAKIKKALITFSLDKEMLDLFNSYCAEKFINKSALLSGLLEEYLNNNKGLPDDSQKDIKQNIQSASN